MEDNINVNVSIEGLRHEVGSLKHRVDKLELANATNTENVHKMELLVNGLINKIDNVVSAVNNLIKKFDKLEEEPREFNKTIKYCIATVIVTTILNQLFSFFINK